MKLGRRKLTYYSPSQLGLVEKPVEADEEVFVAVRVFRRRDEALTATEYEHWVPLTELALGLRDAAPEIARLVERARINELVAVLEAQHTSRNGETG